MPIATKTETEGHLRIAYIVPSLGIGGYERCVTHFVNQLDRQRFRPMVICLDCSGPAAEWITVDDAPIIELHKKPGNDWRIVKRLAGVLREYEVDLVQSHNWGTLVETVLARRKAGTPVHVHAERGTVLGNVNGRGLKHWLRAKAMRWALRRVEIVISNAASVANRVQEKCGYPAEEIRLISNGIERPHVDDPDIVRQQIRRELGIGTEAIIVGSVGRLHSVKGFDLAIRAISQLAKDGCDVHFLSVGDGPESSSLSRLANECGVAGRVHLVGHRTDVGRWLAAMDVYVNTSHSEGMSQSLVEAMAAGLPLVATDVGDSAAVVGTGEQAGGIVVTSNDLVMLCESLEQLIHQQPLRERFGLQARRRYAVNFELDKMIVEFQAMYRELFVMDCLPSPKVSINRMKPKAGVTSTNELPS